MYTGNQISYKLKEISWLNMTNRRLIHQPAFIINNQLVEPSIFTLKNLLVNVETYIIYIMYYRFRRSEGDISYLFHLIEYFRTIFCR